MYQKSFYTFVLSFVLIVTEGNKITRKTDKKNHTEQNTNKHFFSSDSRQQQQQQNYKTENS